jgi:hypothetical protein
MCVRNNFVVVPISLLGSAWTMVVMGTRLYDKLLSASTVRGNVEIVHYIVLSSKEQIF